MKLRVFTLGIGIFTLTACGGPGESAKTIAGNSVQEIGCKTSQSEMWNALHRVAENRGIYPAGEDLRLALREAGAARGFKGPAFERYIEAFIKNYDVTIEGIREKFAPTDLAGWRKALAEMEIGIRVTDVHAELQGKIANSLGELHAAERALQAVCETPERDPAGETDPEVPGGKEGPFTTVWQQLKAQSAPEVYGAKLTFATAYQSCDVLKLPAMTSKTPDVSGITILSEPHPAGGRRRVYGSIASIVNSHYYVKGQRLAKNSCFEVRNKPLIYDFGGKPGTSTSRPAELDMFRNSGSGTEVLGIDCSAYVFSALALAGLKMDPDPAKPLKASLVHGINSSAFKEPQSNGLRCLEKITKMSKTKTLLAGDVVAINGHVVMIDEVGADPFGLERVSKVEDCNSSKLTYSGFDFVIAQSSPSKDGIGINRFVARDYLKESSTYRDGLTRYAVAACKAKFGVSSTVDTSKLSVVRHKKTPECQAEPLYAKNQECVDSCQAL